MSPRTILIVLFEGTLSLDFTGPLEVFDAVDRAGGVPDAYRIRTATVDGEPVRTSSGLIVTPDYSLADTPGSSLAAAPIPHTLIVPGGAGTRTLDPRLVAWLRERAGLAERVVSICTGAFALAEAGLLDGRRVTTHWTTCQTLAREYPEVEVDPDPIFIRDGQISTSAGVTSGIDLALALVEEDLGRDVALRVARHLVVFLRRPGNQTQFSAQLAAQTAQRRPLRDLQAWITEHPSADLSVTALADRANLSPRHFARAFRAEVGMAPGQYVERVRLEAARRMLEDCDDGIEEISRACGYGTPEAMRRAFIRRLGAAPAEYRRRFHPVAN
ncbi:GlxA family transcriptional regulator [Streptomyces sp. XD-27]|uniref:GlxA family transcriptional regulator n=1 Tax=Streptomyces sp. XD-27 TaxID=3062779 RepID=UPI0026F43D0D|nr:GlxA family transcriptional regulator [Streptomyces sp. XD-27]WKX71598.1 GlxA family transcriptional regulator [Streptomyces sp. XD-27]